MPSEALCQETTRRNETENEVNARSESKAKQSKESRPVPRWNPSQRNPSQGCRHGLGSVQGKLSLPRWNPGPSHEPLTACPKVCFKKSHRFELADCKSCNLKSKVVNLILQTKINLGDFWCSETSRFSHVPSTTLLTQIATLPLRTIRSTNQGQCNKNLKRSPFHTNESIQGGGVD
jgi:hypothetical protein